MQIKLKLNQLIVQNRKASGHVVGGGAPGGRVLRPPQQIGAAVRLAEILAASGRLQQISLRQIQRSRLPGTRSGQAPELPRCNFPSSKRHHIVDVF